jgi:hypothetical protein
MLSWAQNEGTEIILTGGGVQNPGEMTGGRANNSYDGGSRLTTRGTEDYLIGMRGLADDGRLDA